MPDSRVCPPSVLAKHPVTDRTFSLDDLVSGIDEMQETDAAYVAEVAGKILLGGFTALSDGETIRHSGVRWTMTSVITDRTGQATCPVRGPGTNPASAGARRSRP